MLQVKDKKVAVIGLGKRTGVETAKMLCKQGAEVVVSDVKKREQLEEEISLLSDCNLDFDFNGHGEKSLECDIIVVSPGVPLDIPFFKEASARGIPVMGEIELAYQFSEAKIIAITGTNGKTTTTSLLGNILEAGIPGKVKVAGNIGIPLIKEITGLSSEYWVVAEISSFQLETIMDFRPRISLFLNFTPDHLDRHHTVENYWQAKKNIFMNQTEEDFAVINIDDKQVAAAAVDCPARKYAVSLEKVPAQGAYIKDDSIYIIINKREDAIIKLTDIPLKGNHNVQNVAFAALTAALIGIDREIIVSQIKKYNAEAHRLDELRLNDNILVVDDSKATNPDAALKAITAFKEQSIILIAGGQDRDADFTDLAKSVKDDVKTLILLGETKDKLAEIVLKTGFTNIYKVKDMQEAVKTSAADLKAGDCLLLSPACPSWDMYSSYKERGREFKKYVKDILGQTGVE